MVSELSIPVFSKGFAGISEIYYLKSNDILFFTFSTEETTNAGDDGKIGDSYLGWIQSASTKSLNTLDDVINLSNIHPSFKNQKIEGVCAEVLNEKGLLLHLVADNDDGQSKIFEIKVRID